MDIVHTLVDGATITSDEGESRGGNSMYMVVVYMYHDTYIKRDSDSSQWYTIDLPLQSC